MVFLLALVVLAALPSPALALSSSSDNGKYYHPYPQDVQVGDLLFGHSSDVAWLIPGYWTHVGIVAYYDPSIGDWMVVEAYYPQVHLVPLRVFMSRYDTFAIGRVNAPLSIREAAVQFALEQIGKPYSFDYFKVPKVNDSSYYCSELAWAAYMAASGGQINLDSDPGWSWKYGYAVAPQEVYNSDWVTIIYYDSVN